MVSTTQLGLSPLFRLQAPCSRPSVLLPILRVPSAISLAFSAPGIQTTTPFGSHLTNIYPEASSSWRPTHIHILTITAPSVPETRFPSRTSTTPAEITGHPSSHA